MIKVRMKMNTYEYITLREHPELAESAAEWFHRKWGVPKEAYLECDLARHEWTLS